MSWVVNLDLLGEALRSAVRSSIHHSIRLRTAARARRNAAAAASSPPRRRRAGRPAAVALAADSPRPQRTARSHRCNGPRTSCTHPGRRCPCPRYWSPAPEQACGSASPMLRAFSGGPVAATQTEDGVAAGPLLGSAAYSWTPQQPVHPPTAPISSTASTAAAPSASTAFTPAQSGAARRGSSRTSARLKSSACSARFVASPSSPRSAAMVEDLLPTSVEADVVEARAGNDKDRPPPSSGGRGPGASAPASRAPLLASLLDRRRPS